MQPPHSPANPYAPPVNPYAPPQAYGAGYQTGGPFNAWLEGNDLVVQKEAPLPDCCLKCGSTAIAERRNQRFAFSPPWVIFVFLLSPIIGAVVAMIVMKRGRLDLPLCAEHASAWRRASLRGLLAVLGLLVSLVVGVALIANEVPEAGIPVLLLGLVALIVVAVTNRDKFVRSKKVDERTITLAQVHPAAVQAILAAAQGR